MPPAERIERWRGLNRLALYRALRRQIYPPQAGRLHWLWHTPGGLSLTFGGWRNRRESKRVPSRSGRQSQLRWRDHLAGKRSWSRIVVGIISFEISQGRPTWRK